MRPCHHIEITTPRKVVLNGLLLGPRKPKRVFIWLHGLNSSMFSKMDIMDRLVEKDTAVLAFNNRGNGKVSYIATTKGTNKNLRGGGAHEVFAHCIDDIDGAIQAARRRGAQDIFLIGHSTGCQKSVFWASKNSKKVRGIVLLAPVSDFAAGVLIHGEKHLRKAEKAARALVRKGRPHELLPEDLMPWGEMADAQRFLSLYTPESREEIFSYTQPKKTPSALRKARLPILAVFAENDEFVDSSTKEIEAWFLRHIYEGETAVIPRVNHGFKGAEGKVASLIQKWSRQYS